MFSEATFTIDPTNVEGVGKRHKIQGIAAETLRAAEVLMSIDEDRTPFDVLAAMPEIDGAEDAKVRMIAVIAGMPDLEI